MRHSLFSMVIPVLVVTCIDASEPTTAAPVARAAPATVPVATTPVIRTAPAEIIGEYWKFKAPDSKNGETEREWIEPCFAISKTAVTILERVQTQDLGGTNTRLPGDRGRTSVGQSSGSSMLDPRVYRLTEVRAPEGKSTGWTLVTVDDRGNKITFTLQAGKDSASISWQSRGKGRSASGTRKS